MIQIYNNTIIQSGKTNMDIQLDFQDDTPLYRQLLAQLQYLIASQELEPGDQLPPIREMADELGINFNTVARVYRLLDQEGWISTQHGRGTYLLKKTQNQKEKKSLREKTFSLLVEEFFNRAQKLGFSSQQIMARMEKYMKERKST